MMNENILPSEIEINAFLSSIEFRFPIGFIDFFKASNGTVINTDYHYVCLWPLTKMVELNKEYNVNKYAPEFFIIGSDGGDTAYAIERNTGCIYELPFIGMSKDNAVFRNETFDEFIGGL